MLATRALNRGHVGRANVVARLLADDGQFDLRFEAPSAGDTSYPGLLVRGNELWASYYASHEGKSSIYLARIPISLFE